MSTADKATNDDNMEVKEDPPGEGRGDPQTYIDSSAPYKIL